MSVIEQAAKRLEELRKAHQDRAPVELATDRSSKAVEDDRLADNFPAHVASLADRQDAIRARTQVATSSNRLDIDLDRLNALGYVTPLNPRSGVAEEFRVIKRPLIRNATGKSAAPIRNGNLIMVTSAVPGEGKSTSAMNLAMSIAMERDHTVLLVDADVSKPSIPRILDTPLQRGLLDVLLDNQLDLSDVLLTTNVDSLTVLPSGKPHPSATELLASEATAALIEEMANRYSDRILIFDSPPLLLSNESRALAEHMGQIVIVVEAERTTHAAVRQALATIESCPVRLLLLNKSRVPWSGYGYGYGYGAASSDGEVK